MLQTTIKQLKHILTKLWTMNMLNKRLLLPLIVVNSKHFLEIELFSIED